MNLLRLLARWRNTAKEPIIAWRAWRLEGGKLRSLVMNVEWPSRQELRAKHFDLSTLQLLIGPVISPLPQPNSMTYGGPFSSCNRLACRCGIYGLKMKTEALDIAFDYSNFGAAVGEVYLWGRVIEHEMGWRAEFAYPKRLLVPLSVDPSTILEFEQRYGVPVEIDASCYAHKVQPVDAGIGN